MTGDVLSAAATRLGLRRATGPSAGETIEGEIDGLAVSATQLSIAMGPDPRPRPLTELRVDHEGAPRGGLFGASAGRRGDTGDARFDERFYWMPHPGAPEGPRPGYLASARLRAALVDLDAAIASAVGHEGMPVFQIDHLEGATRMMVLTHLPDPELLESALRLLVELARS